MITKAYIVSGSGNSYSIRVPTLDKVSKSSLSNNNLAEAAISSQFRCNSDLRQEDSVYIEYEDRDYAKPVIIGYVNSGRDSSLSLKFDSIEVTGESILPYDTSIGDINNDEISFLSGTVSNVEDQLVTLEDDIETLRLDIEDLNSRYEDNLNRYEDLLNLYKENLEKTDEIDNILGKPDDSDESTVYGNLNLIALDVDGLSNKIGQVPSNTNILDIIINLKSRLQELIDSAPSITVNTSSEYYNPTINNAGSYGGGESYNSGGYGDLSSAISALRSKFPHGKYWNHAPLEGNASSGVNNQNGYTDVPCPKHGNVGSSSQTCNDYDPYNTGTGSAQQCWGYAFKCGYDATGQDPWTWQKSYSTDYLQNLKRGDIIRFRGHSVFVISTSDTSVTVTDCNSDGHCQIQWDKTFSRDHFVSGFDHVSICPI